MRWVSSYTKRRPPKRHVRVSKPLGPTSLSRHALLPWPDLSPPPPLTLTCPDRTGPPCTAQYILMEVLSKSEVAQNVIEYYVNRRDQLQRRLDHYNEAQGKGFVCWRFIHEMRSQTSSLAPSRLSSSVDLAAADC